MVVDETSSLAIFGKLIDDDSFLWDASSGTPCILNPKPILELKVQKPFWYHLLINAK